MPKKTKIGKQRKDKFYKLAKETGFRSRAAFKLIQLNRKFEFLQRSRVLVDLCAAPGGWLQVAHQAMPVSSVILGVDLVPIKPIANVITLMEDITTEKCRKALKKEIKTWKVDTVLHDGAPNVGKSWIHDAFMQNQLTLSALKLATELLVRGGWFITKVFRSKDYLSLVWVFKKLFKRVHVTKPQASRNESAEIFIVCQGYLAPDIIDPKFLDPSSLFKDIEEKETKTSLDEIVKQRRKPEGYEEEDEKNYAKLKASDFIFSENHLQKLAKCRQIVFDDADIRDHRLTTQEIKECCKDIKVLGKADLKSLLTWRKNLRETIKGLESDDKKKELVEPTEEEEIDEAVKLAEELEMEKLQEAKRKKKKILKERNKIRERLNLKMIIKDDEPVIEEDRELFRLSQIRNMKDLGKVGDNCDLDSLEIDEGTAKEDDVKDELVPGYRSSYQKYSRESKDNIDRVPENEPEEESQYSSDDELSDEIEFESDEEETKEEEAEITEAILKGVKNPLMVDLVERPDRVKHTVARWFDKEEFNDETNENEDLELDLLAERYEKPQESKGNKPKKEKTKKKKSSESKGKQIDDESNEDEIEQEEEVTKPEKRKKRVRLDPEGMALGSLMVQSKKMKRDIVESAYNRYANNDENLPDWFVEDEKKHYKKEMPVTAEMVREYKQSLKEINARPIKKVVEAKARKKKRIMRRLEKARKKAEKITEHPDMTNTEKAEHLKSIYKKAVKKENRQVAYVVAKKGGGKRAARPAGVKGKYKVVDQRMKKDNRKEKNTFQKSKVSKVRMQKNKRDARRNTKKRRR